MKITRRQLRRIIREALEVHQVPVDLDTVDSEEAYGIGYIKGREQDPDIDDDPDLNDDGMLGVGEIVSMVHNMVDDLNEGDVIDIAQARDLPPEFGSGTVGLLNRPEWQSPEKAAKLKGWLGTIKTDTPDERVRTMLNAILAARTEWLLDQAVGDGEAEGIELDVEPGLFDGLSRTIAQHLKEIMADAQQNPKQYEGNMPSLESFVTMIDVDYYDEQIAEHLYDNYSIVIPGPKFDWVTEPIKQWTTSDQEAYDIKAAESAERMKDPEVMAQVMRDSGFSEESIQQHMHAQQAKSSFPLRPPEGWGVEVAEEEPVVTTAPPYDMESQLQDVMDTEELAAIGVDYDVSGDLIPTEEEPPEQLTEGRFNFEKFMKNIAGNED